MFLTCLGADGSWGMRGFLIRSGQSVEVPPVVEAAAREAIRQGNKQLVLSDVPPPLRRNLPTGTAHHALKHRQDGGWLIAEPEPTPVEADPDAGPAEIPYDWPCPAACGRRFPSKPSMALHYNMEHRDPPVHTSNWLS